MKKILLAPLAVLISSVTMAQAAPLTTTTTSTRHSIDALIGLQWNFGSSTPEVVIGARAISTRANDHVRGVRFDVAFPIHETNWSKPTVRVLGVAGSRDAQGEAGFGYSFAAQSVVLAAGVQGPFVNGGINYVVGSQLMPIFAVNSFGRAKAAKKTTPSSI